MAKIAAVKDGENTLIMVGQQIKKLTHKTIKCHDAIKSDVKFRYLSSVSQIRTATAYRAK